MALKENVAKLLDEQVNKELYSAYLYLAFADYYEERGLKGFANWYIIQVQEEVSHAKILRRYLLDNGAKVTLSAIAAADVAFADDVEPLKKGLAHEQYVTASINECYAAAEDARDFRTMQLLDWFVKEQGEEEKNASDLITKMELFGSDAKGLYMLNSELKARVYAAPSLVL